MVVLNYGWTEKLGRISPGIDPAGIQDAGTARQAVLLPGLTTVTQNVRYISIFAGAGYLRTLASEGTPPDLPLDQYWRRLEAAVAVCSVLHHHDSGDAPPGIVGRLSADQLQHQDEITLSTPLRIPAFDIYKGTLSALGIFDLNANRLFEGARHLGIAWDLGSVGSLEADLRKGLLPEVIDRETLSDAADTFCLCKVPQGSEEQTALVSLLFGLEGDAPPPNFSKSDSIENGNRVTSWRMLLEIIAMSPGRHLSGEFLMARILEPDVLEMELSPLVRKLLLLWRWVAARSFFERGWTQIFHQTFRELKKWPLGINDDDLKSDMRDLFPGDPTLSELSNEVQENLYTPGWLTDRFKAGGNKDSLFLLVAGMTLTDQDQRRDTSLDVGQLSDIGEVKTSSEMTRFIGSSGDKCSDYWADTAMKTLTNHFQIGLRKLRQGNPDSLYVDYENGRWMVPTKGLDRDPGPSLAGGRLDVALGWCKQLGITERADTGLQLTPFGTQVKDRWDEVYSHWQ